MVLCVMVGRELAAELCPSCGHVLLAAWLMTRGVPVRAARAAVGHQSKGRHSTEREKW